MQHFFARLGLGAAEDVTVMLADRQDSVRYAAFRRCAGSAAVMWMM